ncbi:hypothetical protein [Pseudomonas nitroreducens]|uniref:hypothetical protein n=1 Tax=Pseudomonas nitroreducens TaxID=46680 RepID=UPI003CC8360C
MRNLVSLADKIGSNLACAGHGLETIANLLGADGCEHHLTKEDAYGLAHAALALSALIKGAGYDLCIAVEVEQEGGAQ